MVKGVDVAVYNAFMSAKNGTWKGGIQNLGLAEKAVGWALDENNRKLVSADNEKKINDAMADIVAGKIKVADYRAGNTCPVK
jgi:basic membrane protein A